MPLSHFFKWLRSTSSSKNSGSDTLPIEPLGPAIPVYPDDKLPDDYRGQVVFAFECGGKPYFRFKEGINMPIARFYSAYDVFTEAQYALSPDVLKGFIQNYQDIRSKINTTGNSQEKGRLFTELDVLVYKLNEQVNAVTGLLFQMKLATVTYFGLDEDPMFWDWHSAKIKMDDWSKSIDIPAFFLKINLASMLPSESELEANLQTYLKAEAIMQRTLIDQLLQPSLSETLKPEQKETLQFQRELLQILTDWSESQPSSITR